MTAHITFSPIRMDAPVPAIAIEGDIITIDGDLINLASYDAEAAPHPMIVGQPALVDGAWQITVLLPHGADAGESVRFPEPVGLEEDGPVSMVMEARSQDTA